LTEHISATEHDINNSKEFKLVNLQGLSYMPQVWWNLVQKRLRTVGEFCPPLPSLPHGRYITDIRQTLAGVM